MEDVFILDSDRETKEVFTIDAETTLMGRRDTNVRPSRENPWAHGRHRLAQDPDISTMLADIRIKGCGQRRFIDLFLIDGHISL
jgi:hypothetical protein